MKLYKPLDIAYVYTWLTEQIQKEITEQITKNQSLRGIKPEQYLWMKIENDWFPVSYPNTNILYA